MKSKLSIVSTGAAAVFTLSAVLIVGCESPTDPATETDMAPPAENEPVEEPTTGAADGDQAQTNDASSVSLNEVENETNEALNAAAKLAEQKRKESAAELESRLSKIKQDIQSLKESATREAGEMKPELEAVFTDLEQKIANVRAELNSQAEQTADAWEELSAGIESAVSDLEKATDQAHQQLSADNAEDTEKSTEDASTEDQ